MHITLATDGTRISTFTDPALKCPYGVHVTPSGKCLSVDATPILSYSWIMREERNWQLWYLRKMELATQCLSATTPAITGSLLG
ncbi:hypothetical protein DPMN_152538 [Dreissena polymorpha]|uniref:Uncharacterized protein n=1 Tax=Dreissena polymorpha TaxID=45954 RepID=A0A9D4J7F5_DREPO|nr:hypothetical protein DPMN_152538 [Dreissena polymorpha]